jgi:hypothetical protein
MPVQRPLGHPEDRRGLIHRQAGEIAQKDDLGLERVAHFEFLERLVPGLTPPGALRTSWGRLRETSRAHDQNSISVMI